MHNNKFVRAGSLALNIFIPGSVNIFSGAVIPGTIIISLSFILFFTTPYIMLNLTRAIYLILVAVSFILEYKSSRRVKSENIVRYLIFLAISFIVLSIVSFKLSHILLAASPSQGNVEIVYVLGTKPFKKDSTQKMLDMSDDELFELFESDIHPFFRRLRTGIKRATEGDGSILIISAGKNQKEIANKILSKSGMEATFFSCKSTKEEVTALNRYLFESGIPGTSIIIVSDDYHAFRSLMYSRFKGVSGIKDVRFLATSDDYTASSFIKIYLTEQALFALSYITMPLNLVGIVI